MLYYKPAELGATTKVVNLLLANPSLTVAEVSYCTTNQPQSFLQQQFVVPRKCQVRCILNIQNDAFVDNNNRISFAASKAYFYIN